MSFQVINSYHISRMYKLFLAPFFPRDFFFPGFICGREAVVFWWQLFMDVFVALQPTDVAPT